MSRSIALLAAAALGLATAGLAPAAPITFENLTVDQFVAGQGGWTNSDGTDNATIATVTTHPEAATTKVIKGASGRDFLSLDTNTSFGLTAQSAGVVLEADFYQGGNIISVSIGKDGASGANRGPSFGFSGANALVRHASPNTSVTTPLLATDGNTDWYRLRLIIDFTANNGDGAADLLVKNLTDGEANFRTVLTGVDLDIKARMAVGAKDPSTWDSWFIDIQGANAKVDNISLTIPEPGAAVGAVGGLIMLGLRRSGRD